MYAYAWVRFVNALRMSTWFVCAVGYNEQPGVCLAVYLHLLVK